MKKLTSILIVLLAMLTLAPPAQAVDEVDGVYQIGSAADFTEFAALVNGGQGTLKCVLTSDIDMAGTTWTPIGNADTPFKGTIDGQYHKISNLVITSTADYQGLVGYIADGGTIENLIIDNTCSISGGKYVAAFAGGSSGSGDMYFRNLGNEADITGTGANVAAIVGVSMSSKAAFHVFNSYNTGKITGSKECAAITGWGGKKGEVDGFFNSGDVVGIDGNNKLYRSIASAKNVFEIGGQQGTAFTADDMKSGRLAYLLNGKTSDESNAWRQNIDAGTADEHPVFLSSHAIVYPAGQMRCDGDILEGQKFSNSKNYTLAEHQYSEGICTVCGNVDMSYMAAASDVYYEIADAKQLRWFAALVSHAGAKTAYNARLTADIDFSEYASSNMIGETGNEFTGAFDGAGHTVTLNATDVGKIALFGATGEGASIKNLTVGGTIISTATAAALILNLNGKTTLTDVVVSAEIASSGYPLGGFVASATAPLEATNCKFTGSLYEKALAAAATAGFVAQATGGAALSFKKCEMAGSLKNAGWCLGGFVCTVDKITAASECNFIGCVISGSVEQDNNSTRVGGFVGNPINANMSYTMRGCLSTGTVKRWDDNTKQNLISPDLTLVMGCNTWRSFKTATVENCYYTSTTEFTNYASDPFNFAFATDDEVKNGALAYGLNGDQSEIIYYQTLGTDEAPTFDATHSQVYASGRKHCDGTDYGDLAYTNDASGTTTQDAHAFGENHVCTYCGNIELDEQGTFHIVDADGFAAFARAVSKGQRDVDAVLEDDLTISTLDAADLSTMIGQSGVPYAGTFDGQGHALTLNLKSAGRVALFGATGDGAVIKNLTVNGEINSSAAVSALILEAKGATTISNVNVGAYLTSSGYPVAGFVTYATARVNVDHSRFTGELNCTAPKSDDVSGFIAQASGNGAFSFRQCEAGGKITLAGWRAGGYVSTVSSTVTATCEFIDCLSSVDIEQQNQSQRLGGFIGSPNSSSLSYVMNSCLSTGKVKRWDSNTTKNLISSDGCLVMGTTGRKAKSASVKNCYYTSTTEFENYSSSPYNFTAASDEDATGGALCYGLNGKSFENPSWYQDVGTDELPVVDPTHGVVYPTADGCSSLPSDESSLPRMASDLADEAEAYVNPESHLVQKSLVDPYLAEIAKLADCNTLADLRAVYYPKIDSLRKAAEASAAAYAEYVAKVDETKAYIAEHESDFKGGQFYDMLTLYLGEEAVDPSADEFPNGSYAYIVNVENLSLSAAELAPEEAFVDSLLKSALNEGLNPGADATTLLANADFSDKFNHWEGTLMTGVDVTEDGTTRVAESWSASPFDMHQTISVPQNGVYELTLNGLYRVNNLVDSRQHAAMIYLNDYANYLPANMEGVLAAEDAVDKQNCWITGKYPDFKITDADGNVTAYTPRSMQGAAYAFKTDRYPDRILVNVTDKQLTVGIRNPHTIYVGKEWTAISALKLTYRGTIDEAGLALDSTLQSMKQRADYMLSAYEYDDQNYRTYPNYSKALQDSLQQAVAAIATTTENADKYALIGKISGLFTQIYDCKAAYADMMMKATALDMAITAMDGSEALTDERREAALNAHGLTTDGFNAGTYSAEEAAAGGSLSTTDVYPSQNADGAYEIKDAATIEVFGELVNVGINSADAVLTGDVVADPSFTMIGTSSMPYKGKFDGQGHKLTVSIEYPDEVGVGVFRYVNAATVCNAIFDGTVVGKQSIGIIGRSDGMTKISNVESRISFSGYTDMGGFIGSAFNGPQTLDNLLFSGKVTATVAGGGIYGWSSSNTVYANSILSVGEITGEQIAYLFRVKCDGTVGKAGAAGCYVHGKNMYILRTSEPDDYPEHHTLVSGTPLWWGEFLTDVIKEVTADDLKGGKTCYDLNAGSTDSPAWLETLGEDTIPQLMSQSKVVYHDADKDLYYNEKPTGVEGVKTNAAGNDAGLEKAPMYDLSGLRIFKPAKGTIYIQRGRKKVAR